MPRGITPRALASIGKNRISSVNVDHVRFGIPFEIEFTTNATDSTYDWKNDAGKSFIVTQCYGYMTGAGAPSDTVKAGNAGPSATGDITDTGDLSAMGDAYQFDLSEIDDDYNEIKHGDTLRVTTASDALCKLHVRGFWKE